MNVHVAHAYMYIDTKAGVIKSYSVTSYVAILKMPPPALNFYVLASLNKPDAIMPFCFHDVGKQSVSSINHHGLICPYAMK